MSNSNTNTNRRECPATGRRPRATTRPVTIRLDVEGTQLLAAAESEHATVAVYADEAASAAELTDLLGDLRVDLPVQGRRIGVFERLDAESSSAGTTRSENSLAGSPDTEDVR